jgi:hypothetical protein
MTNELSAAICAELLADMKLLSATIKSHLDSLDISEVSYREPVDLDLSQELAAIRKLADKRVCILAGLL